MSAVREDLAKLADERVETIRVFAPDNRIVSVNDDDLPPGLNWPRIVQSAGLFKFRHRFLPMLSRRFGDIVTIKVISNYRVVLFSRPEHIKEIFSGDPEIFQAGKSNSFLGPVMGGSSLLLLDGQEHRETRKLLMPAFSNKALRGYQDMMDELAQAEVATWESGSTFRALDRMNAVTLEVILQVVFGVADEEQLRKLRPMVHKVVQTSPITMMAWNFDKTRNVGPFGAALRNLQDLDQLLFQIIDERRNAPDLEERVDVLSRMIREKDENGEGLGDVSLRDQLVTLLLAGHETTAASLTWTLYELGRHPELLTKAQEAALSGDDGYLEAVFKEAMRLHPVIQMAARQLSKPVAIGGKDFPSGIAVGTSTILAHAREDSYPSPEEFRPERFIEGHVDNFTWLPFGGGVRRCIGASFSLTEGVAILKAVLGQYDVKTLKKERPVVRNITTVPARGGRIRVIARG